MKQREFASVHIAANRDFAGIERHASDLQPQIVLTDQNHALQARAPVCRRSARQPVWPVPARLARSPAAGSVVQRQWAAGAVADGKDRGIVSPSGQSTTMPLWQVRPASRPTPRSRPRPPRSVPRRMRSFVRRPAARQSPGLPRLQVRPPGHRPRSQHPGRDGRPERSRTESAGHTASTRLSRSIMIASAPSARPKRPASSPM